MLLLLLWMSLSHDKKFPLGTSHHLSLNITLLLVISFHKNSLTSKLKAYNQTYIWDETHKSVYV